MTKDFRGNGVRVHNSFTHTPKEKLDKVDTDKSTNITGRDICKMRDENERMSQEVRASHKAYQKKIKLTYRGISIVLLVFTLFTLVMTIGSDFMDFIRVDILQKTIASKIKTSEGFVALAWYITYGLPYIAAIGGFIYLYEWIRKRSEVFL